MGGPRSAKGEGPLDSSVDFRGYRLCFVDHTFFRPPLVSFLHVLPPTILGRELRPARLTGGADLVKKN